MKCEKCGAEFEGNVCPNGCKIKKKKAKKPLFKKWWFWVIIGVLVLSIAIGSTGTDDEDQPDTPDQSVSQTDDSKDQTINQTDDKENTEKEDAEKVPEKTPAQIKADYIASCETVAYDDIARYPDNYKGKNIKFKGQVIQATESSTKNVYVYRINVTEGEYGLWDDTVYVEYKMPEDAPKLLEDDIVTFYGECGGTVSYTSVLGSKITIPAVAAKYIDIEQ